MAKLVVTFENNRIKKELTFRGEVFDYTMIPIDCGKESDKPCFEYQFEHKYPEDEDLEEIVQAMYEIGFDSEDDIEEGLEKLEMFE